MKDALRIALIVLLMIISVIILTAVSTGDISVFAIICPILFFTAFAWFIMARFRSKNPSHSEEMAKGKSSLDAENRNTDKRLKDFFKFIIVPCLILIILLIIFLIAVKYTS